MTKVKSREEIKKIKWLILSQSTQILSQVINVVFLTRLFTPDDYGVFAIGMVIISVVNQIFILGFSAPLIQFDNHTRYYGTAWTFNLLITFIVTIILILVIPHALNYFFPLYAAYSKIFRLLTITVLISGLCNIGVIELYRERVINKLFFLRGFIELLKVIFVFVFFKFLEDYRALIYAFIVTAFIKLILSYTLAPIKSKFEFKKDLFYSLFNFSKWIQLKNITKVVTNQFNSLIVGGVMSPFYLGIFNRSLTISKVPEQLFLNVNEIYIYPLISKNKENLNFIKDSFIVLMAIVSIIVFNLVLLLNLFGEFVIGTILGSSWISIVKPLNILIISMAFNSILNSFFSFFRAKGYPKIEFKLFFIRAILLLIISYPLIKNYNLTGAAMSNLFSVLILIPICINQSKKIIGKYVNMLYILLLIQILTGIVFYFISIWYFSLFNSFTINFFLVLIGFNLISTGVMKLYYPKLFIVIKKNLK